MLRLAWCPHCRRTTAQTLLRASEGDWEAVCVNCRLTVSILSHKQLIEGGFAKWLEHRLKTY